MPGAAVMSKLDFVEHHDDVRRLAGRLTGLAPTRGFSRSAAAASDSKTAVAHQLGH